MSDSVWPQRQQPTRLPCPWDSPGKNTEVGCHFLLQCMKVKSESEVAQSCPTLSDPMDCSLPGSSIHGIFQARVLEWGAIAFSDSKPTTGLTVIVSQVLLIRQTSHEQCFAAPPPWSFSPVSQRLYFSFDSNIQPYCYFCPSLSSLIDYNFLRVQLVSYFFIKL